MNGLAMAESIVEDKQELRRIFLSRRNAISVQNRFEKSIAAATIALPPITGLRVVAVYDAMASEIDPIHLVDALRSLGIAVVFPRVTSEVTLDFCVVSNTSQLRPSQFGLREPCLSLPTIDIHTVDAFVVPALAFDLEGNRLGWGKGHYDRTLAQNTSALRVGFCFQEQIEALIPCQPTDQAMDWIVSDSEIYAGPVRPRAIRPENQP